MDGCRWRSVVSSSRGDCMLGRTHRHKHDLLPTIYHRLKCNLASLDRSHHGTGDEDVDLIAPSAYHLDCINASAAPCRDARTYRRAPVLALCHGQ